MNDGNQQLDELDERPIVSLAAAMHMLRGSRTLDTARAVLGTPLLPRAGETLTVSMRPRTAALCFDRVWFPEHFEARIPDSIAFRVGTDAELTFLSFLCLLQGKQPTEALKEVREEPSMDASLRDIVLGRVHGFSPAARQSFHLGVLLLWVFGARSRAEFDAYINQAGPPSFVTEHFVEHHTTRRIADGLSQERQKTVVPFYASEAGRDSAYRSGSREVVLAALRDVAVVDEGDLHWDQVLEFRKDRTSRRNFRRLLRWLDRDMVGKPESQVVNEIGVRVDDYDDAIAKHGLKTKIGVLSALVDKSTLVQSGATAGGLALSGHADWGLLAAGALAIGRATLTLAQTKMELADIHRDHADVAFVAQARERFPSGG